MAKDLNLCGVHGVAAYTILADERPRDSDAARARLKEAGADAVVIMRVVGEERRITYTPSYVFPDCSCQAAGCAARERDISADLLPR
jgi:hypothetical protein